MKKLLLALTAAASCALVAKADGPVLNQTGFEGYTGNGGVFSPSKDDTGGTGDSYWTWTGGEVESVITNYVDNNKYDYREQPVLVEQGPSNSYLSVDASDGQLMRNIAANNGGPQAIGGGIYFDSLIEFTATDTAPAISNADKLVVWLYGSDETDGTLFGATTGLVVTAGYFVDDTIVPSNYLVTTSAPIEPGSWHRLTIKAIDSIVTSQDTPLAGFVVYVDGQEVTRAEGSSIGTPDELTLTGAAGDLNTAGKLFPSLLQPGDEAASTLTSVAFAGTGAIDDLTFTTENPFEVAVETFTLTVTANGTITVAKDEDVEDTIEGDGSYAVPVGLEKVYVSFIPTPQGDTITSATFNGNSVEVPGITPFGDYLFELDVLAFVKGETVALVITTSGSQPQPPATNTVTVAFGAHVSSVSYCILPDIATTNTLNEAGSFGIADGDSFVFVDVTFESNDYELDLTNTVASLQGATVNPTTFVITPTGAVSGTIYAKQKQAPQPTDWPDDPSTNNGKTASEAYGITGDLANADAGALATWAKAKNVAYNDTILTDAFLLNCANTQQAINAAKEDFKVTSISVAADGTVTIAPADGAKYGNGEVVVLGSATLISADSENWHPKAAGDQFFTVKLVVDPVPQN